MRRTVAIIQARLGSTRLPGKALADICGRSMLERVVLRLRQAATLDVVAIATTRSAADDPIVTLARRLNIPCIRGSETDVLSRYVDAANATEADAIVRISSDCPLIDANVVDLVVSSFLSALPLVDYASNTIARTYPRGLDAEIVTREALLRASRDATAPHEREHVTPFLYERPTQFRLLHVTGQTDASAMRWTVDTDDDLRFVRAVYSRLAPQELFSWHAVIELLDREPALQETNAHVRQKPLYASPA